MDKLLQAQKDGVILGLTDVDGKVHERLDIDVMLTTQPDTFNLYLLALAELQQDQGKMGWFQIAGIHGLPMKDWDEVVSGTGKRGGYCTHGTILFPTFHRPYLAMLEQSIYCKMQEIAQQFENSEKYLKAARQFRLPYWDWFHPRGEIRDFPGVAKLNNGTTSFPFSFSVPLVASVTEVMVYKPSTKENLVPEDVLQKISNPLYSFGYPKTGSIPPSEWDALRAREIANKQFRFEASRVHTVRNPTDSNEKSTHKRMNTVLNEEREGNLEMCLDLFHKDYYRDYVIFSNKALVNGKATVNGSIESLHDNYHGITGGGGHMSRVPVAAFDPIFWMHHCNVDRILAIWQAANPDQWFPTQAQDQQPTETTELRPFRKFRGTQPKDDVYWDSKQCEPCTAFGYTYPDLTQSLEPKDVLKKFTERYSWASQAYGGRRYLHPPKEVAVIPISDAQVFKLTDTKRITDAWIDNIPAAIKVHEAKVAATSMVSSMMSSITTTAAIPMSQPVVIKDPVEAPVSDSPMGKEPPDLGDEKLLLGQPEGTTVMRQWYVDSIVKRDAMDGAFSIYYFVGDFDNDPEKFSIQPTMAGVNHIFVAPAEACDNCADASELSVRVTDTSPVTPILHDYVKNNVLPSLEPHHVVPFLRANLHWRVVGVNLNTEKSEDVPGLTISVSSTVSLLPPDSLFPQYKGAQVYPEVTAGRAGGSDVNQDY